MIKNYTNTQVSAYTALGCWYPLMARCIYTESNFTNPNFKKMYQDYFSRKGLMNNYKGISIFAVAQLFYPMLDITTQKTIKFLAREKEVEFKHKIIGSTMIGGASALIYNPMKTMLVVMQNHKLSMMKSTKCIYEKTGIHGFYRGMTFYIIRNAVYCPSLFILSRYFDDPKYHSHEYLTLKKSSGLIASAMIATTVSMSADVFSTMCASDPERKLYSNNYEVMKTAFKTRGFGGLFVGYKWRMLSTTTEFLIYNIAKDLLK